MKTVMVSGSRKFSWLRTVRSALNEEWTNSHMRLIQGGAVGVDSMARTYGEEKGWQVDTFWPVYQLHGKSAPHVRNQQMVDENPDIVLFFVKDMSQGTMTTLERVVKARIKFRIFWEDDYTI